MKAKRAIKRLVKAQALVSSVVEQYAAKTDSSVRSALEAIGSSIDQAKASIEGTRSTAAARKSAPTGSTVRRRRRHLSPEGRKRLSVAARKRWAAAKRKGMRTLAAA